MVFKLSDSQPTTVVRSIFVSDVHLGSARSRSGELLEFLRGQMTETLYLVGDLVDSWQPAGTTRWPAGHVEVLAELEALALQGTRVIYLPGNHDGRFTRAWAGELERRGVPLECRREHVHRTAEGRRLLVAHGDRFDPTIHRLPWLAQVGDLASLGLEGAARNLLRLTPGTPAEHPSELACRLKQGLKQTLGYLGHFRRTAISAAARRGLDGVVCGHVHQPDVRTIDGLVYHNDGDWVQSSSALVEDADGRMELRRWRAPARAA